MTKSPVILELGTGADVHGRNYTKAALRAVDNAIRHSSLTLFRTLNRHPSEMGVELTIGVQKPDEVDSETVAAALPFGTVTVSVVKGGLDDEGMGEREDTVLACAGIKVFLDVPENFVKLAATS